MVRILAGLLLASTSAHAATWWVSGSGRDSNSGTSAASAFRTLQHAADQTQPGDTVEVLDGTYRASGTGGSVLTVTASGTAASPIVFTAASGAHPVIDFRDQWSGIKVLSAAFITINGFELAGGAGLIDYAYAYAQRNNLGNYRTSANGIVVQETDQAHPSHHITITGNYVHDAPGGGIATNDADYITIAGNQALRNAFWSPFANSGISIYESRDIDQNSGYKNFVTGNLSCANQEYIANYYVGSITDGNGIIIDDNLNTQSIHVPYNGRTYVANNITCENGGSGIHAFASQHVDIVNNTAYLNNQTPTTNGGQFFAYMGSDVNILNNIGYAPAGKVFYTSTNNGTSVVYDDNLLFSATPKAGLGGSALGPHDIIGDPRFSVPAMTDFHLGSGSAAIGNGTAMYAPATDYYGNPRPPGAIDRGAVQG